MCDAAPVTDPLRPDPTDALAAWADRVRRNREQVERRRLVLPERDDYYAPIAAWFRADPRREGDATLDALRQPRRSRRHPARHRRRGRALRPPPRPPHPRGHRHRALRGHALGPHRGHGRAWGRQRPRRRYKRWPADEPFSADVALISHVGYDIEDFGPFLDAMEEAAGRLCIAVLLSRPPPSRADPFWEAVSTASPATRCRRCPSFSPCSSPAGASARCRSSSTAVSPTTRRTTCSAFLRQQLWIAEGSPQDEQLRAMLPDHIHDEDGASSSPGIRVCWES